jgi:trehalose synthase
MNDIGLQAEWAVIRGADEFFNVTKSMHNSLQGMYYEWTPAMREIWLNYNRMNAEMFDESYDYVVIHDPQPAAIPTFIEERLGRRDGKWIWRCHIDLTDANPQVFEFFRPFVEQYDASVWTMPQFVPETLSMDHVVFAPPCIDPLSVKNLDLPPPFVDEIVKQYGVRVHDPLIVQVSRFDPWKDPIGVIDAYRITKEEFPNVQLVLAGSMATDDPEGFHYWDLANEARAGDHDVHLLSNIQQIGNVQVNAFQRKADVIMQKSLREGFGLTVSEGLWKGHPVIGGRCGGITLQIEDGVNGFLVDDVETAAKRTTDLLRDRERADAMGVAGRERVRREFLSTRELEDWLRLYSVLR